MYLKTKTVFLSISILLILSIPVAAQQCVYYLSGSQYTLIDASNNVKVNLFVAQDAFRHINEPCFTISLRLWVNEPMLISIIVADDIQLVNESYTDEYGGTRTFTGVRYGNGMSVSFRPTGDIGICSNPGSCGSGGGFKWSTDRYVDITITFYGNGFIKASYDNIYEFQYKVQYIFNTSYKLGIFAATITSSGKAIISDISICNLNNCVMPQEEEKPWWQQVSDAVTGFFSNLVGGIMAFIDALKRLGEFIWNALSFIVDALKNIGNVFRAVADFFRTLFGFFGNWGDPEKYNALVMQSISDERIRNALAQCTEDDTDDLCSYIKSVRPTGILGYIHYFVWGIGSAWNYILIGLRYFVYLWFGIMVFILANGVAASLKTGSIDPVIKALEWDWKIMTAPFKLLWHFIEFIMRMIQAIAEFIQSIKPI